MGRGPGREAALESPPGRCQEHPHPDPMDRRLRTDNTDLLLPTPTTCTGGRLSEGLSGSGQRPRGWTHWGARENRCQGGDSLEPRAGHRPIRPRQSSGPSSPGQLHLTLRPQLDPPSRAHPYPTQLAPSTPPHTPHHLSFLQQEPGPSPDRRMDRWMHGWTE